MKPETVIGDQFIANFLLLIWNSGWVVGALLNAAKHDGRSLLRILTIIDQQSSEKVTRELWFSQSWFLSLFCFFFASFSFLFCFIFCFFCYAELRKVNELKYNNQNVVSFWKQRISVSNLLRKYSETSGKFEFKVSQMLSIINI